MKLEQDCGQVVTVGGTVSEKNAQLEQSHILAKNIEKKNLDLELDCGQVETVGGTVSDSLVPIWN